MEYFSVYAHFKMCFLGIVRIDHFFVLEVRKPIVLFHVVFLNIILVELINLCFNDFPENTRKRKSVSI